ncbi:unnamed protein product [Arabidopsis thaliana]|uniref:(thale cress) hypothetical protein n=1 Tax=Arabidopsis thaliana TaxID=3702 RepID=A0A7G2ESZ6_ARATH|nr:unnamed protein product [Arabidopsis thaliana]
MPLLELAVIKKVGVPLIAVALRVGAQVIYDRFRKGKDTSIINRLGRTMKSISPVRDRIGKLSNVEGNSDGADTFAGSTGTSKNSNR